MVKDVFRTTRGGWTVEEKCAEISNNGGIILGIRRNIVSSPGNGFPAELHDEIDVGWPTAEEREAQDRLGRHPAAGSFPYGKCHL